MALRRCRARRPVGTFRSASRSRAAPADATIASPAYQQILAVFHATTDGMRAKDTEALRARLKRLVARQILAEPEPEPGLFTLASPTRRPGQPCEQDFQPPAKPTTDITSRTTL
ncbi:hypothetical protein GCM10027280_17330 [Micromonospora polyrhachis]